MNTAVIAGYRRSPFHFARKGELTEVRPDDLAAQVVKGLIAALDIDPGSIEDLIMGCAYPEAEQGMNIARITGFLAGLPQSVAGVTINRFCGSSMTAIHYAVGQIHIGAGEAFICAGVESMTRVPMGGFNFSPNPSLMEHYPTAYITMGHTAEEVAQRFAISRTDQDQLAVSSHAKAAAAQQQGRLMTEIVPIANGDNLISTDGCIRPGTSMDILAGLKPAFHVLGSVTAATSSPLTDGAAAVLVCSEDYARRHRLPMLARIKGVATVGCAPEIMGMGPLYATRKLLQRCGVRADELDVVEINEAFASQTLACIRELGLDMNRVNLDGGAMAIGHPLGATGARITGKAAALLQREGGRYALSTQCVGGGQGVATLLEAIE
ncbi:acetyl-CoA C-acyltransferase [Pokkaliibacter plantistimulans]|uniref:Acetyl-CoA C-acyltransferase n=1 Tax=Proteobacteria bacterium 228 TaxID=2083153 RepID=A0A2S5KQG8_9PROT|nr:thiolase family protein [Pokkaliibacter plantistimulans]PPC76789.1 acetyl-CoA C-acyltransferase [Pokkaliibacter plantistimulans]